MTHDSDLRAETWRDADAPAGLRVADLMSRMSLREKFAQLVGAWLQVDGVAGLVAPRHDDQAPGPVDWQEQIRYGLGRVTRVYGSAQIDPAEGARRVANRQSQIVAAGARELAAVPPFEMALRAGARSVIRDGRVRLLRRRLPPVPARRRRYPGGGRRGRVAGRRRCRGARGELLRPAAASRSRRCRCTRVCAWPWSVPPRPSRTPCSASTPSPGTSACIIPVAAARDADVCVVALGDIAGLFGMRTSGEGCDAVDLRLPGRQEELLKALLAAGTPVVLVLLLGRPYELGRQVDRLSAAVYAFFPGEEGGRALADVLSGRVNPSGGHGLSYAPLS